MTTGTMDEATDFAAQIWCRPENGQRTMDVAFATSIADAVRERFLGPPTDDLPLALPQTPLGEIAELLLHIQRTYRRKMTDEDNDKLAQARILVDVLRGDGQ